MIAARPMRFTFPVCVAALAVAACAGEADESDHHAAAEHASSSVAPATEPQHPGPPCRGKAAGEHACDGAALLRCSGGDASVEERRCLAIERCDAAQGACTPACPEGEVYIPATGAEGFTMGKGLTVHADKTRIGKGHRLDSDVPHRVVLTRPFCMDATEVTVRAYAECVDAGACPAPNPARHFVTYPKQLDHPVNSVEWKSARTYCERRGQELPTEAEWEWAATGGDGRVYPWGNEEPTCERADYTPGVLPRPAADAGCHGGGPSAVGSHPSGDRAWPSGKLHDLAGNVWEWCLDNYLPYTADPETDPSHFQREEATHVVRGGGWNRSATGIEAAFRGGARHDYWVPGLGFRCVRHGR